MGNDYSRKTDKTFRRGRRQQVERLSEPELPTKPVRDVRTFFFIPEQGVLIRPADPCEFSADGGTLRVTRGELLLGVWKPAPPSVLKIVAQAGGRIPGQVVHYYGPNMPCRASVELPQ